MKYLLNFLEAKPVESSQVFPLLKCSVIEARILQFLSKELLKGNDECLCLEVLRALFRPDFKDMITYLGNIKNLINLGWIIQGNFLKDIDDIATLSLLNTPIILSNSFLRLLEVGEETLELPKHTPYADAQEYLKEQFDFIKLLGAKKNERANSADTSLIQKAQALEKHIAQRVALTQIDLPLEELFREHDLSREERIIFLALLQEEYSVQDGESCDFNWLINLVSNSDYERIKNRVLLDSKGRLVELGLIDYEEAFGVFGGANRIFFIPDAILKRLMHSKEKTKVKLESLVEEQEIFELLKSKHTLNDVVLPTKTREVLEQLLKQMDSKVLSRLMRWGIKDKGKGIEAKIIFYGPPGTGKTITALSLAKSLNKEVLSFDCSKILSMYVGESEKNVRKIFDIYNHLCTQSNKQPILLLDEADQFLSARTLQGTNGADKMHNQMQNIFLEQIEKFDGILIATTNLLENLDTAFSRRFNYKIEFQKPNFDERVALWKQLLPKKAPFSKDFDINKLAKFPLSGGQIALVIKNTAYHIAIQKTPKFKEENFINEIERELNGNFDNQKQMGFI